MATPDQPQQSEGRITRTRAPRLYEALGWAALAATLLVIAVAIMSQVNLEIGLAVLVLFAIVLVMGLRSVLAHHQAEDARRLRSQSDYEASLQNLIGSVRSAPSSEPLAPPAPGEH